MISANIENRQIRVFISSTFQDMQHERDYLIKSVFPRLSQIAEARGVTIVPLDLRWGITAEESRSGRVLEICLEEIDNSKPFFIGLVGNRYGWCPSKQIYADDKKISERFPQVKHYINEQMSVTEIEMAYAVLDNPNETNAVFLLRDDNTITEFSEKLESFRQRIDKNGRYPVVHYSDIDEMGEYIYDVFVKLLDKYFPEKQLTSYERSIITQNTLVNSRANNYESYGDYQSQMDLFLENDDFRGMIISGPSGMGKTSLVANWVKRHQYDNDFAFVYHFVGSGIEEGNYVFVINQVCTLITKALGIEFEPINNDDEVRFKLERLLARLENNLMLVVVIDGVNQLIGGPLARTFYWLPDLPWNVKLVVSTVDSDEMLHYLTRDDFLQLKLTEIPTEHKKKLIANYLQQYGKRLSPPQLQIILSSDICCNTLVLRTLLDELIAFGSYEQLDSRLSFYLESHNIEDFFQRVLERCEQDLGLSFVSNVLSFILYSRMGLNENELRRVCHVSPLHLSQLYCTLRNHFILKDGKIVFSHSYIKLSVETRYGNKENRMIRRRLVGLLRKQNDVQAWMECAYQYYLLHDYRELARLLTNLRIFDFFYKNYETELKEYWQVIESQTNGRYSVADYLYIKDDGNQKDGESYYNIGMFVRNNFQHIALQRRLFEKSSEIWEKVMGKDNRYSLQSLDQVSYSYIQEFDRIEGEESWYDFEFLDKALLICHTVYEKRLHLLGETHPDIALSYEIQAELKQRGNGSYEWYTAYPDYLFNGSYSDLLDRATQFYNSDSIEEADLYMKIGGYRHYSHAFNVYRNHFGLYHPKTAQALLKKVQYDVFGDYKDKEGLNVKEVFKVVYGENSSEMRELEMQL